MSTIARPERGEDRVTIQNVIDWQKLRSQHDEFAMNPAHMLLHLQKCIGPFAAAIEHRDHDEPEIEIEIEPKRVADLVISAIWLASAMGFDPASEVANRIWDIGIKPVRGELPSDER